MYNHEIITHENDEHLIWLEGDEECKVDTLLHYDDFQIDDFDEVYILNDDYDP